MRKLQIFLLSGVCVAGLSGCSWLSDWPPSGQTRQLAPAPSGAQAAATPPKAKIMQTADSTWIAPQKDQKPASREVAVAGTDNSGTQGQGDVYARLAALEKQVSQMHNDMSMMMPALTRLASVQGDIQAMLSSQIQPAAGNAQRAASRQSQTRQQVINRAVDERYGSAPATNQPTSVVASQGNNGGGLRPQSAALAPQSSALKPQAQAIKTASVQPQDRQLPQQNAAPVQATQNANGLMVNDIRFGEHPDKTRVVMDVNGDIPFTYDIDNDEKILMIEMKGDWNGASQQAVSNSPYIQSYSAQPDGKGGTRVIMQLSQAARVQWAQHLAPVAGKGDRIVIDVTGS